VKWETRAASGLVLALAVCASGCASCTGPCAGGTTPGVSGSPQFVLNPGADPSFRDRGQPFLDDRPVAIGLTAAGTSACGSPQSVTVSVKDPNDDPVPASAALTTSAGLPFITVQFDAGPAGWYYVQASLQPNLGLTEAQLLVLQDKEASRVTATDLPVGPCNTLDQTAAGTWICDTAGNASGEGWSAVVGNTVWIYSFGPGTVGRYLDGADAGLVSTGTATLDAGGSGFFPATDLLATDQDAVVLIGGSSPSLWWVAAGPDAGAVVSEGMVSFADLTAPLFGLRSGPNVLVVGMQPVFFDGGFTLPDAGTYESCPVTLGSGGPTRGICALASGQVLSSDGAFVWVLDNGSGRMTALAQDGGSLSFVASSPLSGGGEMIVALPGVDQGGLVTLADPTSTSSPVTVLPQTDGQNAVFQLYSTSSQAPTRWNRRFAWTGPGTGVGFTAFAR
jgi:hypothetical protein